MIMMGFFFVLTVKTRRAHKGLALASYMNYSYRLVIVISYISTGVKCSGNEEGTINFSAAGWVIDGSNTKMEETGELGHMTTGHNGNDTAKGIQVE
jgi:hypothetical protein